MRKIIISKKQKIIDLQAQIINNLLNVIDELEDEIKKEKLLLNDIVTVVKKEK